MAIFQRTYPKNQRERQSDDDLTVLLIKDDLSSRAFKVPFHWINRFGVTLGAFFFLACIGIFLAGRFYMLSYQGNPERVRELEKKIIELQQQQEQEIAQNQQIAQEPSDSEATPVPEGSAETAGESGQAGGPITLFAPQVELSLPPSPSVTVDGFTQEWTSGSKPLVRFNLQYALKDGRNQTGFIVVLARGKESLLAYPPGIVASGSAVLLPEKGETFSVSRLRPVEALLPSFPSTDSLTAIDVLIFDRAKKLVLAQTFAPTQKQPTHPRPKPAPKVEVPSKPKLAPLIEKTPPPSSSVLPQSEFGVDGKAKAPEIKPLETKPENTP